MLGNAARRFGIGVGVVRLDTVAEAPPTLAGSMHWPGDLERRANHPPARGNPRAPNRRDPPLEVEVKRPRPRRLAWAELLQRVFEVDALRCPRCGARMRLLAAIEEPGLARRILECLDLPARAPPLSPAPAIAARLPSTLRNWKEGQPRPASSRRPR